MGGSFALIQFTGALAGGILMLVFSRLDYRRLRPLAWPIMLGALFLCCSSRAAVHPQYRPETQRRPALGPQLGPLNFQPSELARLAVIIWCAMLATKKGEQVRQFKKGVVPVRAGSLASPRC